MNSTKSETICSISFVDMPILGFLILNRTFHFHVPLSTSCMEILFALVRSAKLTLGHRASVPAWKSQIYVLEGVSSDGWTVQGDEQNALNISRRIIRIYNPTSFDDYMSRKSLKIWNLLLTTRGKSEMLCRRIPSDSDHMSDAVRCVWLVSSPRPSMRCCLVMTSTCVMWMGLRWQGRD